MKRNKGFTLIELLIVIAIIAILASVILASLQNARAKRCEQDKSNKSDFCVDYRKDMKATVVAPVEQKETKTIDERVYEEIGMLDDFCEQIPDLAQRRECQDQQHAAEMLQNCIDKYEYKGPNDTN